jgi:NADPH-dependent 7-cyano-7-deazaguanine reductase QueF
MAPTSVLVEVFISTVCTTAAAPQSGRVAIEHVMTCRQGSGIVCSSYLSIRPCHETCSSRVLYELMNELMYEKSTVYVMYVYRMS